VSNVTDFCRTREWRVRYDWLKQVVIVVVVINVIVERCCRRSSCCCGCEILFVETFARRCRSRTSDSYIPFVHACHTTRHVAVTASAPLKLERHGSPTLASKSTATICRRRQKVDSTPMTSVDETLELWKYHRYNVTFDYRPTSNSVFFCISLLSNFLFESHRLRSEGHFYGNVI